MASKGLLLTLTMILAVVGSGARDEMAARRRHIEQLTAPERETLRKHQLRFAAMAPEEQTQLRTLYDDIAVDTRREHLLGVLENYRDWLETISGKERSELESLPAEQRIDRIRELKQEQATRLRNLTSDDRKKIAAWLDKMAWKHRDQLMPLMPPGLRASFNQLDSDNQHLVIVMTWMRQQWRDNGGEPRFKLPADAVAKLANGLSPDARQRLESATPQEKKGIFREWAAEVIRTRMAETGLGARLATINDDELRRFESDELSAADRERLNKMSPPERQRELWQLYGKKHGRMGPNNFLRGWGRPAGFGEGPHDDRFGPGHDRPGGEAPGHAVPGHQGPGHQGQGRQGSKFETPFDGKQGPGRRGRDLRHNTPNDARRADSRQGERIAKDSTGERGAELPAASLNRSPDKAEPPAPENDKRESAK